jgi:hypothetical protein
MLLLIILSNLKSVISPIYICLHALNHATLQVHPQEQHHVAAYWGLRRTQISEKLVSWTRNQRESDVAHLILIKSYILVICAGPFLTTRSHPCLRVCSRI